MVAGNEDLLVIAAISLKPGKLYAGYTVHYGSSYQRAFREDKFVAWTRRLIYSKVDFKDAYLPIEIYFRYFYKLG